MTEKPWNSGKGHWTELKDIITDRGQKIGRDVATERIWKEISLETEEKNMYNPEKMFDFLIIAVPVAYTSDVS